MTNIRTIGIMALAGILSFTFTANDVMAAPKDDQKGPRGPHMRHCGPQDAFHEAFAELDNDKKALFFSIMEENKASMAPLRDQMWAKRAQLKAISDDTTTDMAVLTKITDDIVALRQQMRDAAVALDARMAAEVGIETKFAMKALEGKQGDHKGKHRGEQGRMGHKGQDCKPEGKRGGHCCPCDSGKGPHGHKGPHGCEDGPRDGKGPRHGHGPHGCEDGPRDGKGPRGDRGPAPSAE